MLGLIAALNIAYPAFREMRGSWASRMMRDIESFSLEVHETMVGYAQASAWEYTHNKPRIKRIVEKQNDLVALVEEIYPLSRGAVVLAAATDSRGYEQPLNILSICIAVLALIALGYSSFYFEETIYKGLVWPALVAGFIAPVLYVWNNMKVTLVRLPKIEREYFRLRENYRRIMDVEDQRYILEARRER